MVKSDKQIQDLTNKELFEMISKIEHTPIIEEATLKKLLQADQEIIKRNLHLN